MAKYDLGGLEPDDLRDLIESVHDYERASSGGDASQDMAMIGPLAEALQALADRVQHHDEMLDDLTGRHNALEDHYFNELIKGITDLYDESEKDEGIQALKEKFGEDFEPYGDYLDSMMDGGREAAWGHVYGHLKDHWDEDDFDPDDFMDQILDELQDHFSKMKEALGGGKGAIVKIVKDEEPEEEPGIDEDDIREEVEKLRGKRKTG